jgi:hypothetical protein
VFIGAENGMFWGCRIVLDLQNIYMYIVPNKEQMFNVNLYFTVRVPADFLEIYLFRSQNINL